MYRLIQYIVSTVMASLDSNTKFPDKVTHPSGTLRYRLQGVKDWTNPTAPVEVINLVFDYSIRFCQKSEDKQSVCKVLLGPGDYISPMKYENAESNLVLEIALLRRPTPESSGANAHELGLTQIMAQDINALELTVAWTRFKPTPMSMYDCRSTLAQLTSGSVSTNPATNEGAFVQSTMDVSIAESKAQEKAIGTENGRISTFRRGNNIVVQFWPAVPDEKEAPVDIGSQRYGMIYEICSKSVFPEKESATHPTGTGDNAWQIVLIDRIDGVDAPVVGFLQNSFMKARDIDKYANKTESDVKLVPITIDTLGQHTRSALKDYAEEMDDFNGDLLGFFRPKAHPKTLPKRAMFLEKIPYREEENVIPGDPIMPTADSIPPGFSLNERQVEGVLQTFKYKVSLVWGPAATGKSQTVMAIMAMLMKDSNEKILACAPRHVAVDSLLKRCRRLSDDPSKLPIVRLYSHFQILAQYRGNRKPLEDPFHIDNVRLRLCVHRGYSGFRSGRQQLMELGDFNDKEARKAYLKDLAQLDERVRAQAKVVFCTTAATRNSLLRWRSVKGEYATWAITTCIMDEAACANPLEILLPLATFPSVLRYVLVGDHKQFPPYLSSNEGKSKWAVTLFEHLAVVKKFPHTMLNVQYRTHDDLAEANSHVIYKDKLRATFPTANPRAALQRFLNALPLQFSAGSYEFKLSTYLHFIDVDYGSEEGEGSKYNTSEIDVIFALVRALARSQACRGPESIAILTGYARQYDEVKKRAQTLLREDPNFPWQRLNYTTVGKCQGYEWDIVIISLVKTDGSRRFLNQAERANVATSRARECQFYGMILHLCLSNASNGFSQSANGISGRFPSPVGTAP